MKTPKDWPNPACATAAILMAGFVLTVAVNWPGHLSYDSILQLQQGRAGVYNSWHPPVMAWLMGWLDAIRPGTGLFVVFDAALAFGALAVLTTLRPARATWSTAGAAFLAVLLPQLLLYQGLVWKDVLFADAAVAGFAALALAAEHWRSVRLRATCLAASFVLLLLAALTRQNGAVLVPFAATALGWMAARQGMRIRQAALLGTVFLAALVGAGAGATALLNLRSDGNPGVEEQIQLLRVYDLSGMVQREPGMSMSSLDDDDPHLEQVIRSEGARLYTPLRNDPLASSPQINAALSDTDPDSVGTQWWASVTGRPWLYLKVRAADFYWLVAAPDVAACRPVFDGIEGPADELKALGIAPRRDARDFALDRYGKAFFRTPVFSHPVYFLIAAASLFVLLRRRRPADLAVAGLLAGAFAFSASFFVIAIACDYRYLYLVDLSALTALLYLAADTDGIFKSAS